MRDDDSSLPPEDAPSAEAKTYDASSAESPSTSANDDSADALKLPSEASSDQPTATAQRHDSSLASAEVGSPIRKGSPIRRGSPFAGNHQAVATANAVPLDSIEILDPEWGVLRSATWASLWVAFFSFACWQLFPGGGVVVASLGCGLAVVGLFSSRPIPAVVLLAVHVGLFFGCYQQLF